MTHREPLNTANLKANYSHLEAVEDLSPNHGYFHSLLGSSVLMDLTIDAKYLFLSKSIRMFAFGFLSVMLVVYLEELGIGQRDIGLMFSLTLMGDMLISLYLTGIADRFGRRHCLLIGAALSFITGVVFTFASNYWILLVTAIFGVISPSGSEVGPFMAIEIASLSQVTNPLHCTKIMAWYNLFSSFSSGFGALFCGTLISILQEYYGCSRLSACRTTMIFYSIAQGSKAYIFYLLSSAVEVPAEIMAIKQTKPAAACCGGLHKSQSIVMQLSVLFCLDSFAGAFVLQSFTSAWFVSRYNTDTRTLGLIVFVCNFVAGLSALVAAPLAERIGLIVTMAVTHLPSNILIILVPLMPDERWAIAMLCARYCISQMDVPTRNAYVQGVVAPEERSAAQGVTNVVRTLGAAVAPYFAEKLYMRSDDSSYPFYIAGVLKIIYDLMLLYAFQAVKTDHEHAKAKAAAQAASKGSRITATVPSAPAPPSALQDQEYQDGQFELPVQDGEFSLGNSYAACDTFD